ncbi:MAG: hypothetical protein C0483_26295 [Pirellula sp.]|nr:hypothetical protein [Pirellula sp.]
MTIRSICREQCDVGGGIDNGVRNVAHSPECRGASCLRQNARTAHENAGAAQQNALRAQDPRSKSMRMNPPLFRPRSATGGARRRRRRAK